MPKSLEHSFKALVLRELIRHRSLYSSDLKNQFASEDHGKVDIALERLVDVKFVLKFKASGLPAYGITAQGKAAYEVYKQELEL